MRKEGLIPMEVTGKEEDVVSVQGRCCEEAGKLS